MIVHLINKSNYRLITTLSIFKRYLCIQGSNSKVICSTSPNIGTLSRRISPYLSIVANSTCRLGAGIARRNFAPNASRYGRTSNHGTFNANRIQSRYFGSYDLAAESYLTLHTQKEKLSL